MKEGESFNRPLVLFGKCDLIWRFDQVLEVLQELRRRGAVHQTVIEGKRQDHHLTLWVDGVASDEDPGIPTTLVVHGFADQTATGFDILHSFGQELIISNEDANLVIQDLLVRDYPLIVSFTVSSPP